MAITVFVSDFLFGGLRKGEGKRGDGDVQTTFNCHFRAIFISVLKTIFQASNSNSIIFAHLLHLAFQPIITTALHTPKKQNSVVSFRSLNLTQEKSLFRIPAGTRTKTKTFHVC